MVVSELRIGDPAHGEFASARNRPSEVIVVNNTTGKRELERTLIGERLDTVLTSLGSDLSGGCQECLRSLELAFGGMQACYSRRDNVKCQANELNGMM